MPNKVTKLQLAQYKKAFSGASFLIAVGYPKLNVKGIDEFRGKLAERKLKMLFVRNRIANIACGELGFSDLKPLFQGQTAFVWGEDPVSAARFLVDFQKEHSELKIHGATLENAVLGDKQVLELSKSPTKEELKSIISGQVLATGAKLSAQAVGAGRLVAGQIKKLADKEEEKAA